MSFNSERKERMKEASKYFEEAMKLEREALLLRRGRGYSTSQSITPEEIGGMYEKAGDLRVKAKDFIAAQEDYSQAQKYGFPYDDAKKKSIDKKIQNLLIEKRSKEFFKRLNAESFSGSKINGLLSIASLLISLFFVSAGITGYSILNLETNNFQTIGLCFFACGLIFALVYLRNKK